MQPISQASFTPQALAQGPISGANTLSAAQPLFGNTEEPGQTDPNPAPAKKGFFATITEFVQQNGVVQGSRQFFAVVADVLDWNRAFEEANVKSSYAERLQSLFYLAFAEFCEGYQSRNAELEAGGKAVKHALYANVLKTYPKLLLAKAETLPVDLVQRVIESAEDPAATADALKAVQEAYQDSQEVPEQELKAKLSEALSA